MPHRLRSLALAGVLVVAACAPSAVPPLSSAAPTTTVPGVEVPTTAAVPPGSTVPKASGTTPPGPNTTAVSVPLATAEEIAALLPSTPVTTAPPGAVRASTLERQEFILECLRSFGFEGEIQPDLGILSDVPEEQFDRYLEVGEICRKRELAWLGVPEEKTEEDRLKQYSALLYVRECMLAEGYPVDDPPSPEVWVESGGAIWHPYDRVMGSTGGSLGYYKTLEEICPANLFYLYEVLGIEFGP